MRTHVNASLAAGLLLLLPAAAAAQLPLGGQFRVNAWTTAGQASASVGADFSGNFVVVWESYNQGEPGQGVFGQRFDAAGNPLGGEFHVNTYTTGHQYHPRVAVDTAGNFVVVWENYQTGLDRDVFARLYDSTGAPRGPEFRVNSYVTGHQRWPAASADASGRIAVVWESDGGLGIGQDGDGSGIFAQLYDPDGTPNGSEFRVNAFTTGQQRSPAVHWGQPTQFVVTWDSDLIDNSGTGVRARRFQPIAGGANALGLEFTANQYTTGIQNDPTVAMDLFSGNFVIAWTSAIQEAGGGSGIYARRFDSMGDAIGGEFHVNSYTSGNQAYADVAVDVTGDFVVTWQSPEGGFPPAVLGRRYHASGEAENGWGWELPEPTGPARRPTVASAANGNFVVTWQVQNDGSGAGVFARRFQPDVIFRDGFEDAFFPWAAAVTDGDDLTVSGEAALRSSLMGMRGVVDDTAGLYVQDITPTSEGNYHARFHFDPNGFDPGESLNHRRTRMFIAFAEPTRRVAAIVLRRLGGAYSVMARARLDDNTQASTPFIPISDGPHFVEISLQAATQDLSNGSLWLYMDGGPPTVLSGLDNHLGRVDFARLGALSVKTGANGVLYWDEFQSRRLTSIGY